MLRTRRQFKFAALLLTVIIMTLSSFLLSFSAMAAVERSSDISYDAGKAYYNSDYKYLNDENSVFQSITWEEAVYLFQQEGNYLVLFGGSWCPNTTAVIDYINEAAKAAGVDTIYNLDFRLDGTNGDTHIRETNGSAKIAVQYNYLYGELVTRYLTNLNDWVEYTADSASALTYTNSEGVDVTVPKVQVPFLFLYNKDNMINHAGDSEDSVKYPIVYGFEKMVYRDANGGKDVYTSSQTQDSTTLVADYAEQLNGAIFDHLSADNITLSGFTDGDYIRLAYNEKSGKTLFDANDRINIQTITYKQLDWLLGQDGKYILLFGGSWCGNTQAVINIINDYAVENNVTVYNFDTKLDSGYAKKYWGYSNEIHIRDNNNPLADLYVDLVNKYLDNIETEYTIESGNYIYYTNAETGAEVIANKLQVPYLFAYNKDAVDDNGHDTPILSYIEKMYVLDASSDAYILSEANFVDYTTGITNVITAHNGNTGADAVIKDTVIDNDNETPLGAAVADTDKTALDNASAENTAEENNNIAKIIVAVIAGVAVIGVVVFLALKKGKTSGGSDGGCC